MSNSPSTVTYHYSPATMNAASVHRPIKSTTRHTCSSGQSLTELMPYYIAIAALVVLVFALGLTVVVLAVALHRARKTTTSGKGQSMAIQLPPPPGKQCTRYSRYRFLYYFTYYARRSHCTVEFTIMDSPK